MQRSSLVLYVLVLLLSNTGMTRQTAQQVAPRKYLIKPLNLSINTEIRARSTRNIQVRVTDENDRPVPDAPVIFLLRGGDASSGGNFGSLTGQMSRQVKTDAQGIAQVEYTAGEEVGSKAQIKAKVEGSDTEWEGVFIIIGAFGEGGAATGNGAAATDRSTAAIRNSTASEKSVTEKKDRFISSLVVGQMPKPAVARRTFTTTDGEKISLDTKRGKVVLVLFFGVWCDISKRELLFLDTLLRRYKIEDFEVIGMSVKDPRATPPVFLQFLTEHKSGHRIVQDVPDKHFVEFVNSKNISVPQTLIYGRNGRLRAHFLGFNPQVGTEIEQNIKEDLEKKE